MAEQVYGAGLNTQPQGEYDFISTALQIGEFQERKKQRVRQERQSELGDGSAIYNRAGASIRHQPLVDLAYQGWVEAGTMYQKTGDPEYKMQAQNYLNQLKDIQANAKVINDYSFRNAVDARRNPHLYGTTSVEVEQGFNKFQTPLEGYIENGVVMVKDEDGQARPYNEAQAFKRDYSVPKSLDKIYGSKSVADRLWRAGYQNSKGVKTEDANGNITYNPDALKVKAREGALMLWNDNPTGFQEFAVVSMLKEDNPDFNLSNPEDMEAYSIALADPDRSMEAKEKWVRKVEDDIVARTPATNLRQASSRGGSSDGDFDVQVALVTPETPGVSKEYVGKLIIQFNAPAGDYAVRSIIYDSDGEPIAISFFDKNEFMEGIRERYVAQRLTGTELEQKMAEEAQNIKNGTLSDVAIDVQAKIAKTQSIKSGKGQQAYNALFNNKSTGKQASRYNKKAKEFAESRFMDAEERMKAK